MKKIREKMRTRETERVEWMQEDKWRVREYVLIERVECRNTEREK